jgi:L-asparaginase
MSLMQPPKVTVFSLGGTIASTSASGGGVIPQLGARELVAAVPELSRAADLEAVAFRQTSSANLTLADLAELAGEIRKRFDAGTAGAVITQGTDTIEETSFALELLVGAPGPVVVTGAMRNPTLPGADGPANLLAAVQVAASPAARGLGALVVLNDEIHAARFVRKSHTSSPSTFRSITAGPLGWIVEGKPRIGLRTERLPAVFPEGPVPPVALLKMCMGDDDRLIGQIEPLGYAGLVVEAFGGGHVPTRTVEALTGLAARMPVVLASRTGGGELLRVTYAFPGSERNLLAGGLVPAGFLDGPKARILLSLLLANGADIERVRRSFEEVQV